MAVDSIRDFIAEPDFREIILILFDSGFYEILFPLLLMYAVLYTVLTSEKINLFRSNSGLLNKAAASIVAGGVAFIGVTFETSPGMTAGTLLMLMFPNISALTIGILVLYILGAMMGRDFFKGMFDKSSSAYLYFAVAIIGFGAIVYFVGIAFGAWDFDPFDQRAYWSVILSVAFLILGVVLLFSGRAGIGFILLYIVGTYIYDLRNDLNFLDHIFDPALYVIVVILFLLNWLGSGKTKEVLRQRLIDQEETRAKYVEDYGREPKDYESRAYDVIDSSYDNNKKEWKRRYGDEEW